MIFGDLVVSSPGGSRRCPAAFEEVSGGPRAPEWWPESSGRGLDDDFQVEAFSCQVWLFSLPLWARAGLAEGGLARSRAVPRGAGKPRAPERWPESSGRSLDDDFLVEAFSCQVWLFSVLPGVSWWLQEVSSCVKGGLRRVGEA